MCCNTASCSWNLQGGGGDGGRGRVGVYKCVFRCD